MSAIDRGELESIEPAVIEMASRFPRVEGWKAGLCYLYCELGRISEARDLMDLVIGRGALGSFPRNSWFGTIGSLTLACRVIEAPHVVEELYPIWLRFSGQMAVVGFSSFCWGSTDRFLGILAGLMDRWEESSEHFERAIAANRLVGARPALAHTYADQATMLQRGGREGARKAWDCALSEVRILGMKNLERKILGEAC
jgi:hypothetical protein